MSVSLSEEGEARCGGGGEVAPLITGSRRLAQPATANETKMISTPTKKKKSQFQLSHLGWLVTGVTGEPAPVIKYWSSRAAFMATCHSECVINSPLLGLETCSV